MTSPNEDTSLALRVIPNGEGGYRLAPASQAAMETANNFLTAQHVRGLSPDTIRAYANDLVALFRWLADSNLRIEELQESELLEFVLQQRQRGRAPRTINRRLTTCRLFYRFCTGVRISTGRHASTPAPYYRGSRTDWKTGAHYVPRRAPMLRVVVPKLLVEPLTIEQVRLILRSFHRYRDLAIVQLMLFCGLRSSEVLGLTLAGVAFVDCRVRVRGKGNKERVLPLPPTIVQALDAYLELERPDGCHGDRLFVVLQGQRRGEPMTRAGLRSLFRWRRMTLPEVSNANPHRLRHTFGTDMARAGVPLLVLQKMMGHSDPSITIQYVNLSMADIAAEFKCAIERIRVRYEEK